MVTPQEGAHPLLGTDLSPATQLLLSLQLRQGFWKESRRLVCSTYKKISARVNWMGAWSHLRRESKGSREWTSSSTLTCSSLKLTVEQPLRTSPIERRRWARVCTTHKLTAILVNPQKLLKMLRRLVVAVRRTRPVKAQKQQPPCQTQKPLQRAQVRQKHQQTNPTRQPVPAQTL